MTRGLTAHCPDCGAPKVPNARRCKRCADGVQFGAERLRAREMARLRSGGMTMPAIAARYGISKQAVFSVLKRASQP